MAERLERDQALERIEEFGAEGAIGLLPRDGIAAVHPVPGRGRDERDQRRDQKDRRDGQIEPGQEEEDQNGRESRHEELRQVLAEIGFKLFDALDHGEHHVARALAPEMGRAQRDHLVIDRLAQIDLDQSRGVVSQSGAQIFEQPARQHDNGHQRGGLDQCIQRRALDHERQQPAKQAQARDANRGGQHAHQHAKRHATAHADGQCPQPFVEIHKVKSP